MTLILPREVAPSNFSIGANVEEHKSVRTGSSTNRQFLDYRLAQITTVRPHRRMRLGLAESVK